ncbi:MAG: PLP-dependent transferase [Erythrobacter sp.]|nr:PLP-dependent transferase [Erythrobacter sp.]
MDKLTTHTSPYLQARDRSLVDDRLQPLEKRPGTERSPFKDWSASYHRSAYRVSGDLMQSYELAASYQSMEDFWRDAELQSSASSPQSFWDTYESGLRRRIENQLALVAGASSALLLNSGMAAIDAAVAALDLRPNDTLLCQSKHYFETEDYLENVLARRGVRIELFDDEQELNQKIKSCSPKGLITESFLNGVDVLPIPNIENALASGLRVIIDNSVLGPAARWLDSYPSDQILIVESGLKYLCHRCSSGAIYGGSLVDEARAYARRIGSQLQTVALLQIQPGEISTLVDRARLHGANRRIFVEELGAGPWKLVRDCDDAAAAACPATGKVLLSSGGGSLIFLVADAPSKSLAKVHRTIVEEWAAECTREGNYAEIKAGFGWDATTLRSYEPDPLNRKGGGLFIRVSVGVAPEGEIRDMARILNEVAVNSIGSEA